MYGALVHPKHIPSLDLARAGLKSAPAAAHSQTTSRSAHSYDGLRPVTQGGTRRHLKLSAAVEDSSARVATAASGASTERQANMTPRDFSALPAPLQEALFHRISPDTGRVSAKTGDLSRRGISVRNSQFHLVNESVRDPFADSIDHSGEDGAENPSTIEEAPAAMLKAQMTPRQRFAIRQSTECFNKLVGSGLLSSSGKRKK